VPGYTGELCEIDIDECKFVPCQNNAQCIDGLNNFTCVCPSGWEGRSCGASIDDCKVDGLAVCQNGAKCIDGYLSATCTCAPGYEGETCAVATDDCASNLCENDSTCIDKIDGFSCVCLTGWFGTTCDQETDFCLGAPTCENGGTCVSGESAFECKCRPGWTGATCSVFVDPCSSAPCQNDAKCSFLKSTGAIVCKCSLAYSGDFCGVFHPTPVAVSATVAPDLSGFLIAFDAETNLRGDLPCGKYLNTRLLGNSTKCLWGSDLATGSSLLFLSCPANDWCLPLTASHITATAPHSTATASHRVSSLQVPHGGRPRCVPPGSYLFC
jgi:hypothetical protein